LGIEYFAVLDDRFVDRVIALRFGNIALQRRNLLFFTGDGGVERSAISAATAMTISRATLPRQEQPWRSLDGT
jgi:hypothetical protein